MEPLMTNVKIERYLDQLFDVLSGTGRRGRRFLAEVEAHLTEGVEALQKQGLTVDEATDQTLAHFGSPEDVAKASLREGVLPLTPLLLRVFAAAWLLGSIGMMSFSVSGVLDWLIGKEFGAVVIAPDAPGQSYSAARCADLLAAYPHAATCQAASVAHHFGELVYRPISLGVIGLVLFLLFWVARRGRRFRAFTILPPSGLVALIGVIGFGSGAAVLLLFVLERLQIGESWGTGAVAARGVALLAAALFLLPGAWREVRRRITE
jgi:hypothetical protein